MIFRKLLELMDLTENFRNNLVMTRMKNTKFFNRMNLFSYIIQYKSLNFINIYKDRLENEKKIDILNVE